MGALEAGKCKERDPSAPTLSPESLQKGVQPGFLPSVNCQTSELQNCKVYKICKTVKFVFQPPDLCIMTTIKNQYSIHLPKQNCLSKEVNFTSCKLKNELKIFKVTYVVTLYFYWTALIWTISKVRNTCLS